MFIFSTPFFYFFIFLFLLSHFVPRQRDPYTSNKTWEKCILVMVTKSVTVKIHHLIGYICIFETCVY